MLGWFFPSTECSSIAFLKAWHHSHLLRFCSNTWAWYSYRFLTPGRMEALGNLWGFPACCFDSCSLWGVKPKSLFLIHVLFSLKKNTYPALRIWKRLTPTSNVPSSVPVIRNDIEWLSTRGSGTISTAFSPHLEFSCLANFNSLVESSIQIWSGLASPSWSFWWEYCSQGRSDFTRSHPPRPQRSVWLGWVCVCVCVCVCVAQKGSLRCFLSCHQLSKLHIWKCKTHTHRHQLEVSGLVTVNLPSLEHRLGRES